MNLEAIVALISDTSFKAPRLREAILKLVREEDPKLSSRYKVIFLKNLIIDLDRRNPDYEPFILRSVELTYKYIVRNRIGEWLEAEPILSTSPTWGLEYANRHKKARFPEVEPTVIRFLKKDFNNEKFLHYDDYQEISEYVIKYASDWPELEELFAQGLWRRQPGRDIFISYSQVHKKPMPWFEEELLKAVYINGRGIGLLQPDGRTPLLANMRHTIGTYLKSSYGTWSNFIALSPKLYKLLKKTSADFEEVVRKH